MKSSYIRIFKSLVYRIRKISIRMNVFVRKKLQHSIKQKHVINELKRIGIKPSDKIIVHSAMSKMGVLEEGAKTFVESLKELITENGTIIMPTHSASNMYDYLNDKEKPPYSVRNTSSRLGKITEYFRKQQNTFRSIHPTHSVAAWGLDSEEYVQGHEKSLRPFDKYSPYPKIISDHFITFAIGVDLNSTTVVRVADDLMKDYPYNPYTEKTFKVQCINHQDCIIDVETYSHRKDVGKCRDNMLLYPYLKDYISTGNFFNADIMIYDSKKIFEEIVKLAHNNITTYKES